MARMRRDQPEQPGRRRALAAALAAALPAGAGLATFGAAAGTTGYVVKPWPEARPVPPLALDDLDGKPWMLSSVAGKVVLLNFWATWCEPCRAEMPSLAALAAKQRKSGVAIVTVNYKEPVGKIRAFLAQTPLAETSLRDADGDATAEWTPRVFPSTVVIGRDGKPVFTVVGALDWAGEDARRLLAPLIAAPRPRKAAASAA